MEPRRDPRALLGAVLLAVTILAAAAAGVLAKDRRLKWEKDWGKPPSHKAFPKDCGLCHPGGRLDKLRKDFSFDHLKETGRPLLGAHAAAPCLRCHNDRGPVSSFAALGCAGCHGDPHQGSQSRDCARCHGESAWKPVKAPETGLSRHDATKLPLTGAHARLRCSRCHERAGSGDYKGASPGCSSCHQKDYVKAKSHSAGGYSKECRYCHSAAAWTPANEGHAAMGEGLGESPDCYGCHQSDYEGSKTTPASSHLANGFPKTCLTCHNTTAFGPGTQMRHHDVGSMLCFSCHRVRYEGAAATPAAAHAANAFPTTCQNCHNTAAFGPGTAMRHELVGAKACYDCHRQTYQGAPGHAARDFPRLCQNCHTTFSWLGARPDHASLGASPDCVRCHRSTYNGTSPTPAADHAGNGFPTTCQDCHTTASWGPGTAMRHERVSARPCYGCHAATFQSAPNHAALGFPRTCDGCHRPGTWQGPVFDHSQLGGTPLCYGCHQSRYAAANPSPAANHAVNGFPTTCRDCHNTSSWGPGTAMQHQFMSGRPCYGCHAADYQGNSDHVADGFPTDCGYCHKSFASFDDGSFSHAAMRLPHNGAGCRECHPAGDFTRAACTCRACHSDRTCP